MKKRRIATLISLLPFGAAVAGMALVPSVAMAQSQTPQEPRKPEAKDEPMLPTVKVTGTREGENTGYQGTTTNVGKIQQLPRDIPQSVTTVTQGLIHDRNADSFKEALRNVAGLTFNAGEGGRIGDNITLRGYSAVGDLYLDGIRDIAQYNREVFNLEQIDVLRGSASMLFGRGSTGGIINQASKQPRLFDGNTATLTFGNHRYARATADLNQVIGENSAVRLNVMKTDADSFREGVNIDRWGIAPSVRWGIGTKDEFSLSYYYLKYDDVPDYGVPYFQGRPLLVPVTRFYGLANADYQRDNAGFLTAAYTHRFDADTSVRTVLRKAEYERDLWAVAPRLAGGTSVITDATILNRQAQRRAGEEDTLTSQTDFTTKANLGGMKHQFLAGVEIAQEKAYRWNWGGAPANPATTVGNPNPFPELPPNFFSATRTGEVRYTADTVGVYGQDIMELTPLWKLVFGARHDDFSADYQRAAPLGPLARIDRVWSLRSGLLFQPNDEVSYYVSYGTSFNPSGELYSLDDRSTKTPPEKNRNVEIGAKWDLLEGNLALRTALFRSEKSNERNTDLAVSVEQNLLSGKRHTDGIEFEAAGRLTQNWDVFGAVAFMRAKIDAATGQQANTLGKRPINTPNYTLSMWSTYRLTGAWKIGGGFEAVDDRFGDTANNNTVPKYHRWDALIEYQREKYVLRLNVLNLFDKSYYEGVYQGHVVPGTKRSLQLTAEYKF